MESLIHVTWIAGAASLVFAWCRMGLFGGPSQEELDAIAAERDELKKRLARGDVRVDEQKKKVAKLQAELEQAMDDTKEVRRRAAEHRDECRKLQRRLEEIEARVDSAPAEVQRREELLKGLKEEVRGLKERSSRLAADLEEARQQAGSLERDKARLEAAAERAAAAVEPGLDAVSDPPASAPDDGLKVKLRELKETLRIKDGLLRKIRRQAEHNRRAYVITQLQLDLAHDEVYELKHGKPRRDTERSRRQRPEVLPAAEEADNLGADAVSDHPDCVEDGE